MNKITKKDMKAFVRNTLAINTTWAYHALKLIFSKQTDSEQVSEITKDDNGVGFTGCDAEILSSFAKQLERNGSLSPKQNALLFRKIPKYWKQILDNSDMEKMEYAYNHREKIKDPASKKVYKKQQALGQLLLLLENQPNC